tara:strand:+ start:210 stop:881 length:672 start_codon:yes stop_codon:yes gene_type:complete
MKKRFTRPQTFVEAAMDGIRSSIIKGDLLLGQPLTESYLTESFSLSKTPIREALTRLKQEGLVVSEHHKGFKVFKMDEQDLSEFCELRLALESQALKTAYKKNRLELIQQLKNIINEMQACAKKKDFIQYNLLDTKFHKTFFILASNRYLLEHYDNINSIIETIRTYSTQSLLEKDKLTDVVREHLAILKNIESKKLSLALRELGKHINSWYDNRIIKSGITK